MQVALDTYDRTTVYADLRAEESLTDDLRSRAIERARQLGAQHVEFWRPPYGGAGDRMAGFVELACVPEPGSEATNVPPPADPGGQATREPSIGPTP